MIFFKMFGDLVSYKSRLIALSVAFQIISFAFVYQELCYVLCCKAKIPFVPLFIFIEEIIMEVSKAKKLICEDNDERN